jgi:sec-independent protein translocase protein TatA
MNMFFAAGFVGGWQIVLILALVLIFFGARKLPELAKGLGQGIKEFKKASRDAMEDKNSIEENKS